MIFQNINKPLFVIAILFCLSPWGSPPVALLLGIVLAWTAGNPFKKQSAKATHYLLQASVVGLGFGMNAGSALKAGSEGILFAVCSIAGTLLLGYVLGKVFKTDRKTSYLIASGTAICGGSAIAAVSPVIKAEEKQISVALGVVFILNSAALFLFPAIGHLLGLSQQQFGLWSAIAIHDTSSVVGAAGSYGTKALEVATTVKLARALWIIPVAFLSVMAFKTKDAKVKIPYFIGLFVLAMLANTYLPVVQLAAPYIVTAAKAGLTLTLFLIGSSLSREVLLAVGVKPFVQGVLLWVAISVAALVAVISFG